MTRARPFVVYGLLLATALALGLATQGTPSTSRVPSVDNPGPLGLRALFLYLEESGAGADRIDASFSTALDGVRTLVIAAPTAQAIESEEVDALEAFVRRGGRLVYLAPADFERAQPALARWLKLFRAGTLKPDELQSQVSDVGGAAVAVWLPPNGARQVKRLRVAAGSAIGSHAPEAVPASGQGAAAAVLHWALGRGEIWVFGEPSVAQNRRLERDDNLAFFAALALDGRVAFDERHHRAGAAPTLPRGLVAIAAQLLLLTFAYAAAKGTRFGAPRAEPVERHRSILEYVTSMAWLIRRARVEPELAGALARSVRVAMFDRASIPLSASDAEAAVALELRLRIPRARTETVLELLRSSASGARLSTRAYLRCSQASAALIAALNGGKA